MAENFNMYPQHLDATPLFSQQFFDAARTRYVSPEDKDSSEKLDAMYDESKKLLEKTMNSEQSALFAELESLAELNLRYAASVGFLYGVRVGRPPKDEDKIEGEIIFSNIVVSNFLRIPGMFRFPEFHDRRMRINELQDLLCGGLDDISADHISTVAAVLLEREYSAALNGFDIGRQYAP